MDNQDMWKFNDMKTNKIDNILNDDETVLYRAKPKKSAYIWSAILGMCPAILIWLGIDSMFIIVMFYADVFTQLPLPYVIATILFFAVHLTPVWIWLGGIIKSIFECRNVEYAITDKRIIIRSGVIGIDFNMINYNEIDSVDAKVGVIDRMLHVGDIHINHGNKHSVIYDIAHPYEVLTNLQKITLDIKADIHYPNDLRPSTNHGYNTEYMGTWQNMKG